MRTPILPYLLVVLDEDLHHDVLELDVHDGCDRLLLRAEQSGPEDHAQIGDGHQVLMVMTRHTVDVNGSYSHQWV